MSNKKITSLKDWLIFCTLAWGLPVATILTIIKWKEFTAIPGDIIRLYFTSMGGGFCLGGSGFFASWLYLKIKTWILSKIKRGDIGMLLSDKCP